MSENLSNPGTFVEPVFGRLLTAMVTPFAQDGSVDEKQVADLANYLVDNGNLPRTPSGKVDREAAAAEFESFAAAVEQEPENWKAWFNLACMYDAVGERKRARAAMRNAWSLRSGGAAKEMR